jgi:hypothetical protein
MKPDTPTLTSLTHTHHRVVVTSKALYFDPDPLGAAGTLFEINEDEQEEDKNPTKQSAFEPQQRFSMYMITRIVGGLSLSSNL